MAKSMFDSLNNFIRKRYKVVIIAWIIAVLFSLVLIPSFFSSVSYDLTGGFGAPPNSEAEKASSIVHTQFSSSSGNSSGTGGGDSSIIVVLQNASVYSDALKQSVLNFNQTLYKDAAVANYTGETSYYSLEESLLNSSLPDILSQTGSLQTNIATINSGLYMLQGNLSELSSNLFQLQDGINQTAQLVYGVPAAFIGVWQGVSQQMAEMGDSNPVDINTAANSTVYGVTNNFGGDSTSIGYYTAFFGAWAASFQTYPTGMSVSDREALAINQSVSAMLTSNQLDAQTSQMVSLVASGLTVSDWTQPSAILNLAESTLESSIPTELSASLGASPDALVNQLYSFGPAPSNSMLEDYSITLLQASYSNMTTADAGFSVSDLMHSAYALGTSGNETQAWNLACSFISNATQITFQDSPLFTINNTALSSLLTQLSANATNADINIAINNLIATLPVSNYPYIPSKNLSGNFINSGNDTMLVVLNFKSDPAEGTINQVKADVQNSGLQSFGAVYVTGGPVLTTDVEKAFLPALEITVGPGIAISLIIVGLLFLAPIAALIPVLIGGVSVSVALAAIYEAVVGVGKGNLTFLTPTLTILLMLGLAVDYSVLQLRRTKEERQQGKSIEESVGVSLKWAGQAVLTAGVTVIVAYIVMAVANVPIFSDVGTAIALGVAILLASVTNAFACFGNGVGRQNILARTQEIWKIKI